MAEHVGLVEPERVEHAREVARQPGDAVAALGLVALAVAAHVERDDAGSGGRQLLDVAPELGRRLRPARDHDERPALSGHEGGQGRAVRHGDGDAFHGSPPVRGGSATPARPAGRASL